LSVKKTRNAGTQTEAAFFSGLRSCLRRHFRFWKPIHQARLKARRKYKGENKRRKWVYICNHCGGEFMGNQVQVDHIIPAGSLRCLEDLAGFVERLAAEDVNSYQILCKPCHTIKTKEERRRTKENETNNDR